MSFSECVKYSVLFFLCIFERSRLYVCLSAFVIAYVCTLFKCKCIEYDRTCVRVEGVEVCTRVLLYKLNNFALCVFFCF